MSRKIEYATQACGRCGGSGSYSYNAIDGDRCYGCNGKGTRLTKAAAASSAKVAAFIDQLCSVPFGSLAVGDRIRTDGGRYVPVLEVQPYGGEGQISVKYRQHSVFGWEDMGRIVQPSDPIRKRPSPEQYGAIFDFARGLHGVNIVEVADKVPT